MTVFDSNGRRTWSLRDTIAAAVMIPAAFMGAGLLRGAWFTWGLPILILAMFTVVNVMREGWDVMSTRRGLRMLLKDAAVIAIVHVTLLGMKGAIALQ